MDKRPTSQSLFKALSVLAIVVAGYLIGVSTNRSQTLETVTSSQQQYKSTPTSNQAPSPESKQFDSSACIKKLKYWASSADAISQQFPLYDTIANTRVDAFEEVALHLIFDQSPTGKEAIEVLFLHWRVENPLSLLRFRHSANEFWGPFTYYNTSFIVERLLHHDPSELLSTLKELEAKGAKLEAEYKALFRLLNETPPNEQTRLLAAHIQQRALELGIDLTPTLKQPPSSQQTPVTVANVLLELENNPSNAHSVFSKLVTQDVETAVELALSIQDPNTRQSFISTSISHYTSAYPHDSVWLLTELYKPNDYNTSNQLIRALGSALKADPSAAKSWAENEEASPLLTRLLRNNHLSDPNLLPILLHQPDSQWRTERIKYCLRSLGQNDYAAADAWISQNLSGRNELQSRISLMHHSLEKDHEGTLAFVQQIPPGPDRNLAVRTMVQSWVQKDFDAALAWAKKRTDPSDRSEAFQALAHQWVSTDFAAAKAFSEGDIPSQTLKAYQQVVFEHLRQYKTPQEALDYMINTSSENNHTHQLRRALSDYANEDPRAAFEVAVKYPQYNHITARAIHSWFEQDPPAALNAVLKQTGPVAETGIQQAVNTYTHYDPKMLLELEHKMTSPEQADAFYHAVKNNRQLRLYSQDIYQQLVSTPKN
ncbi:hypothetical protein [Pelagicoccus mobilis]|uniref:Uncharacterized protein n=1 Tax=Pelagicoccus mobilis TaxID=415221 RepID=A0A934VRL6_9BACT|nr:hypothetical protein [Pelagicoccus mobilis]MBK1879532.1 hypothetical protein [Pelagicoccus mobilis]